MALASNGACRRHRRLTALHLAAARRCSIRTDPERYQQSSSTLGPARQAMADRRVRDRTLWHGRI